MNFHVLFPTVICSTFGGIVYSYSETYISERSLDFQHYVDNHGPAVILTGVVVPVNTLALPSPSAQQLHLLSNLFQKDLHRNLFIPLHSLFLSQQILSKIRCRSNKRVAVLIFEAVVHESTALMSLILESIIGEQVHKRAQGNHDSMNLLWAL